MIEQTTIHEGILDTLGRSPDNTVQSLVLSALFDKRPGNVNDAINDLVAWGEVERNDREESTQFRLTPSVDIKEQVPENVSSYVWQAYLVDDRGDRTIEQLLSSREAAVDHLRQVISDGVDSLRKVDFLDGVWTTETVGDESDGQTAVLRCEPVFESTPCEQ